MTLNRIKFDENIKKEKEGKNETSDAEKISYSEKKERREESGENREKDRTKRKEDGMERSNEIIEKDVVEEWDKKIKEAYYLWEKYGAEIPQEKFAEFQDGMRNIPKFMKFKAKMTASVLAGSYKELGDTELLNILFGKGSDEIVKKANVLIEMTGFKVSSGASLISNLSNLHNRFSAFLKEAEELGEENGELEALKKADFEILDWLIDKSDKPREDLEEEFLSRFVECHASEAEELDHEFYKPKTKEDAEQMMTPLIKERDKHFKNIKETSLKPQVWEDTSDLEKEIILTLSLDKQIKSLQGELEALPARGEYKTLLEKQSEMEDKYDTGKMTEKEYKKEIAALFLEKEARRPRLEAQIALREAKKLTDEITNLQNELKNIPSKKQAKKENIEEAIEEKKRRRDMLEWIADKLLNKSKGEEK